jgi:hypothetical protein
MVPAAVSQAGYYTGEHETQYFLTAKASVFERDWDKARGQLEAYYWLARSFNQMSQEAKQAREVIRLKKLAITNVDLLLGKYPESIWKDDADVLRLETAAQLALLGDDEYQKYIEDLVAKQDLEKSELMTIALEALIQFGPEVALPLVEGVLNEETDPELRKTAVTLIGKAHGTHALPLLRHLETEDADPEIRKEAKYWRKKSEMLAIPVYLSYYGYVAQIEKDSDRRRIPENKLSVFDIPALRSSEKKDVEKAVKKFFDGNISDLKFATNAALGLDLGIDNFKFIYMMKTSHNLAGFRVSVSSESIVKSHFDISGKASFFDTYTDREYAKEFAVDADDTRLMAMRHGDDVAILVLVFESTEEPIEEKDEPIYYTEINNVFGSVVHSSRQSWDVDEFDAAVVEYGRAKAVIPGDAGTWVLIGHIQMHRKTKRFIGRDAKLYNPKREVVAEGLEIIVPAEEPAKYEVKDKKK